MSKFVFYGENPAGVPATAQSMVEKRVCTHFYLIVIAAFSLNVNSTATAAAAVLVVINKERTPEGAGRYVVVSHSVGGGNNNQRERSALGVRTRGAAIRN